jgi:hypothetical protein
MIEQNQGDCYELKRLVRWAMFFVIGVPAILVAGLVILGAVTFIRAALAVEPTPQQIAACAPDAQRLCASVIPDHVAVRACMIRHRSQLSQACREAFGK